MNRIIHYLYIIALLLLLGVATPAFGQTITGNVFGAGEGEEGHPDKAKVTGTTYVKIDNH